MVLPGASKLTPSTILLTQQLKAYQRAKSLYWDDSGDQNVLALLLNNNIIPKFVVIPIWDAFWTFAYVSQITFIKPFNRLFIPFDKSLLCQELSLIFQNLEVFWYFLYSKDYWIVSLDFDGFNYLYAVVLLIELITAAF